MKQRNKIPQDRKHHRCEDNSVSVKQLITTIMILFIVILLGYFFQKLRKPQVFLEHDCVKENTPINPVGVTSIQFLLTISPLNQTLRS